MNLLTRREHSREELWQKLRKRYDEPELREAIDALAVENLQSDERFAAAYVRERMMRGFGPLKIVAELTQRGVSASIVSCALEEVPRDEETTWIQVAQDAYQRRFGDELPHDLPDKARRLRFLNQRGFSGDQLNVVPEPFS